MSEKTRKGEFMRGKIVTTTNIPTSRMPIKKCTSRACGC